jgi:hypothetical protein
MNLFKLIWRDGIGRDSKVLEVIGSSESVLTLWLSLRNNLHPEAIEIWDLDGNRQHPEKGLNGFVRTNPYVYDSGIEDY